MSPACAPPCGRRVRSTSIVTKRARSSPVGGRAAEEWARGQGCTELASDTWIDNEVSQRAHAALGFELVDRCVNYRKLIAGAPASSSAAHYGADLARVHHEYFGHVADSAASE